MTDFRSLATLQRREDDAACAEFPFLRGMKDERLAVSPRAWLRGSVDRFDELLGDVTALEALAPGRGWIVGDMHLENLGAFRVERATGAAVVFDVNDFDSAAQGPWCVDVVRLATSVILASQERAATSVQVAARLDATLRRYAEGMLTDAAPALPACVQGLLRRTEAERRGQFLAKRTQGVGAARRFLRGARYVDLPERLASSARAAFVRYTNDLAPEALPKGALDVIDAAFRVAGNGSLGVLRVAVLTRGHGDDEGQWVFEMKAQRPLVPRAWRSDGGGDPAASVRDAMKQCLPALPRMLGVTTLDARSMLVRRLAPQEDRLDLAKLDDAALDDACTHGAALLARAHRRGAAQPARAWRDAGLAAVRDAAISQAAWTTGMWLAHGALPASAR